jgi:hypothetical protein
VGDQDRVDAVLERGPVPDQVEAEAGALALGPDRRVGQPDLRHQREAAQLGQDPGVDLVRLAGQRCQPLGLDRVGDPHLPARELEPIVHEAGAIHRLDHRDHLRIAQSPDKPGQTVGVGRHRPALEQLPAAEASVEVESLAAQIQSDVQHCVGLLRLVEDARSITPQEALLHAIQFFGVIRVRRQHSVPPANRDDPAV